MADYAYDQIEVEEAILLTTVNAKLLHHFRMS